MKTNGTEDGRATDFVCTGVNKKQGAAGHYCIGDTFNMAKISYLLVPELIRFFL
jgi:hypothetical protein